MITALGVGNSAFAQAEAPADEHTALVAPLFTLARVVMSLGVEDREPIGVSEIFSVEPERVYCFLEAVTSLRIRLSRSSGI